ncbi:zf-HC2 domain-containing protein [Candidatus Fermentibacteria bacterium]|nr:zf-HC2 domain-containing protein [Candidatus Fermentibacteria bacterium]
MNDHPIHLMDEYIDGTLANAISIEVEAHLQTCERCREEERFLRSLRARVSALPAEVNPPHDVWPRVRSRILETSRVMPSSRRLPLLAAAMVLIAVMGILHHARQGPVAPIGLHTPTANAILAAFDPAEHETSAARAVILTDLTTRHPTPAVRAALAVWKNVAAVDRAIEALRTAVRRNPGDVRLIARLRSEYQRKTALIKQTASLLRHLETLSGSTT